MKALEKGRTLEERVATWAKRTLGWSTTKRGELVRGKTTRRPWEVDVHAEKWRGLRHAWIECKAHRVRRIHVLKLKDAVDDVREAHDEGIETWAPHEIIMVSSEGFDSDALAVAKKHDIKCYLAKKGFQKMT